MAIKFNEKIITVILFFSFISSVSACIPPYPNYRLHLTVTSHNTLVVGASVFVFNHDKGIKSDPIQHAYTDSFGNTEFGLGPGEYDILVFWSDSYTVKENISVPFSGEYITIDLSSNLQTTVFNKCYNWLPWTFGILCVSLIIGTLLIDFGLKTSWKKAISYSFLINIPSVIIGIILCLLL